MEITKSEVPFRHWVVDEFIDPTRMDVENAYHEVPPLGWSGWTWYGNDCEMNKLTAESLPGHNIALMHRLIAEATEWISDLVGVPGLTLDGTMYGAGVHVMAPNGHLNCHLDYALAPHAPGLERRANLILFLNPAWREEWGGALELYDDAARKVITRVYPRCNRAVIWESSDLAYHGVERVASHAPPRVTAASYYLAPARPGATRKRALFVPNRGRVLT